MAELRKLLPRLLVMGCLLLLMGWVTLYGEKGYIQYRNLKEEKAKLIEQKARLVEKNRLLYSEIVQLKEDQAYIERTARQELGLAHEGETIYRFRHSLSGREHSLSPPHDPPHRE